MRPEVSITNHAMMRFRERIDPGVSDGAVLLEMIRCLGTAKAKHFKRLDRNTVYIPTDRCIMICSWGKIVTVIERRPISTDDIAF